MSSREKCNKDDIIDRLREILSSLHYSTRECVNCNWIDHTDDYKSCEECGEYICKECISEAQCDKIYCADCGTQSS